MRVALKTVIALTGILSVSGALAQELFIYPKEGQSQEQQEKDKYECYGWAKQNSGFDPMAPPTATSAPPKTEEKRGGVAKGAVVGGVLGRAIGGSADAGWKSAAAGGLIGGISQSSQNRQSAQRQDDWEREQASQYAGKRSAYNRAYSACLEGRGYNVK